ncbi:hypothetical protein [Trueperella pyogenes]
METKERAIKLFEFLEPDLDDLSGDLITLAIEEGNYSEAIEYALRSAAYDGIDLPSELAGK